MAYVKLAPLVLLVIAGAFAVDRANLHWRGMPPLAAIGQGTVILFFAFMGTETCLNTGGEAMNPARTIPLAILLALSMVAALYIGLANRLAGDTRRGAGDVERPAGRYGDGPYSGCGARAFC